MTILDMIGRTRLIPLRHIVPEGSARILVKLEYENPSGSMKDRMALAMIEAAALRLAERLGSGRTVVTIAVDSGMKYLSTELYANQ